jgi:hypothetical protein
MTISIFLGNTFRAVLFGWLALSQQQGLDADAKQCTVPQPEVDSTYTPGQVWSYNTRPGEASSTVTILRVERTPKLGVIVHVRIDGVQFKNCKGGPAPTTSNPRFGESPSELSA